jgi:hypothetical protein
MASSFAIATDAAKRVLRPAHLHSQAPKRLSQSFHNPSSIMAATSTRPEAVCMGYGNAGLSVRRFGLREKDACDIDGEPRQQRGDEPVAVAEGLLAAVRSHRRDRG